MTACWQQQAQRVTATPCKTFPPALYKSSYSSSHDGFLSPAQSSQRDTVWAAKKTRPSTHQAVLNDVSCLVCDENERLVKALGRYAARLQREVSA